MLLCKAAAILMLLCKAAAILMLFYKAAAIPMVHCTVFRFRMVFLRIGIQYFRSMLMRFRIQGFDDHDIKKIYSWYFFISEITSYLSLGHHKGRPSYRKSFQPSMENIEHFKIWNFLTWIYFGESFLTTWIRIQPTKTNTDPCGSQTLALYLGYYWSPTVRMKVHLKSKTNMKKCGSIRVALI